MRIRVTAAYRLGMLLSSGLLLALLLPAQAGARAAGGLLYVSDESTSSVLVYKNDAQLVGVIKHGIAGPGGMSVDRNGDLFVANAGANDVTAYRPGETSPYFTISQGLTQPSSVAVGNDGTVYVTDFFGDVLEYHAGATQPFLQIPVIPGGSGSSHTYPVDAGIDGAGNVYVYYEADMFVVSTGFVIKYPPGSTVGTALSFIHTTSADGIDLDHTGDIAVAWEGSTRGRSGVAVYKANGHRISRWDPNSLPSSLRLSADESRLYTTNLNTNAVEIYSYPDGRLFRTVQTPIRNVFRMGVAVSPAHLH